MQEKRSSRSGNTTELKESIETMQSNIIGAVKDLTDKTTETNTLLINAIEKLTNVIKERERDI